MFNTFQGLPLHPLVVHATVVLVPLMCLLTVLVAVRPVLRGKFAWWTFMADVLVVGWSSSRWRAGRTSRSCSAPARIRSSSVTNSWASS